MLETYTVYLFVNLAIPEVSRDGTSLQSTSFSCNPQSSVSAIRVIANWCLDYLSNWLHVDEFYPLLQGISNLVHRVHFRGEG